LDELKAWLRDHLKIRLNTELVDGQISGDAYYRIKVVLELDGEEIDSDYDTISA